MTDPRWLRIKDLTGEALELPPEQRADFLDRACAGDAELRCELDSLLAASPTDDQRFEPPEFLIRPRELARQQFGDFELNEKLGAGGSGEVFLARQRTFDRVVAIKVLRIDPTTSQRRIERFHREQNLVAKLNHPHIVHVLAAGQEEGFHWFAMDYVEGHDLGQELALQRQRDAAATELLLPRTDTPEYFRAVARLVGDAADAVQLAHDRGIVHRDLKPQNLLLDRSGCVRVADFGIAYERNVTRLTRDGERGGTPVYMSPEQVQPQPGAPVDAKTDVYALGVVLYEALTLAAPFRGRTDHQVMTKILLGGPTPPRRRNPRVPPELETICLTAMARQPAQRYASASALSADLRRWLTGQPIAARPPHWTQRARQWIRRWQTPLTLAAMLVLSFAIAWVLVDRPLASQDQEYLASQLEKLVGSDFRQSSDAPRTLGRVREHGLVNHPRVMRATTKLREETIPGWLRRKHKPIQQFFRHGWDQEDKQARKLARDMHEACPEAELLHACRPKLTLRVTDQEGSPVNGTVTLQRLDTTGSPPLEPPDPFDLPVEALPVEAGYYRLTLQLDVFGQRELTRLFEDAVDYGDDLEVWPTPTTRMVEVPLFDQAGARLSPLKPFEIDRCEVSNAEYRRFEAVTGYRRLAHLSRESAARADNQPQVQVSWLDALAYAEWAGKRLPSYAEWAFAAGWPDESPENFPAGPPPQSTNQHTDRAFAQKLADVDGAPALPHRLDIRHLDDNVWEWTETRRSPLTDSRCLITFPEESRQEQDTGNYWLGFRCARSLRVAR